MSMGRATCPLLWAAALGGCPAVWSISHHRGYCSRDSTVRLRHPCGLSCGIPLLGRRPALIKKTTCFCEKNRSKPVIFKTTTLQAFATKNTAKLMTAATRLWVHDLGRGRMCPNEMAVQCPGPLGACSPVCASRAFCVRCPWPLGACSPVCALCAVCAWCWRLRRGPPPFFWCLCFFSFFFKREEKWCRKRQHYRHRHGQLEQRCSSAVFLVVVCVAGVFPAVAPQGCGSRVIMYTGAG